MDKTEKLSKNITITNWVLKGGRVTTNEICNFH